MSDNTTAGAILGFMLGTVFVGGFFIGKATQKKKDKKIYETSAVAGYERTKASTENTSKSNTYTVSPSELERMIHPDSIDARYPRVISYGDLATAVDTLKSFPNAKLIGVDNYNLGYYKPNNPAPHTYLAKGLLFELDSNKTVTLIAPDRPYFIGQRYDINYYTFQEARAAPAKTILKLFLKEEWDAAINEDVSDKYQGLLSSSKMNKRE